MCVPWELNPRPFALLTQCSTTEPQEQKQELQPNDFHDVSLAVFEHLHAFALQTEESTEVYCFLCQIYSAVAEGMMF